MEYNVIRKGKSHLWKSQCNHSTKTNTFKNNNNNKTQKNKTAAWKTDKNGESRALEISWAHPVFFSGSLVLEIANATKVTHPHPAYL